MDLQPYLIPYTIIISASDLSPAEEGLGGGLMEICSLARKLATKFFNWIIEKGRKVLTKLGLLKKQAPLGEKNAIADKQVPHLDKALSLSTAILNDITRGYLAFKLQPIRSSKTTALKDASEKITQKVSAARGEIAIVQEIGNGKLYIAPGSLDKQIEHCKSNLEAAENCQEKVMQYFNELTKSDDAAFKAAASQDISTFNAAVTDFVSFYTLVTNMILMIQMSNH